MRAPKNILDIIISNKTSLGDNPALPPELDEKFLVFLVNNHYNELSKHFDDINVDELTSELNQSLTECKRIESKCKEALEKLCSDIVNEIFMIPENTISIDMKLVTQVDTKQLRLTPENTSDYSFDSIEDMNNLTSEIYKRRLLNALTIGAAMYYAENVDAYREALSRIDPRLPSLYKKILCINSLLLFHTKYNLQKKYTDGGKVDVYLSDPTQPVKIKAEGIMFPVLLEESIKGLLELSISHGLPQERSKAEYVTSKTDFKLAELWDQRLGLPLWKCISKVMKNNNINPIGVGLNFIFMEISQLKPSHFNGVMQEIFAGTKVGHNIINQMVDKIQYNKEQDEFDDYITQRNDDEQFPLNDEEFTSDDLINDDLCATNILDETNE